MINFIVILMLIVKHVQKKFGEKTLNEMIYQGVAVCLEIMEAFPSSRSIKKPIADQGIVNDVLEELSSLEA